MKAKIAWRRLPLLLATLAGAGLAISIYLTASHAGNRHIVCAGLGECEYVNTSEYAAVGGVPISLFGAALYASMIAAALLWAFDLGDERRPVLYWGLALAGAAYAGYLTYVELAILQAICVWCVASATILAVSLGLATAALVLAPEEDADEPAAVRRRPGRARRPRPSSLR